MEDLAAAWVEGGLWMFPVLLSALVAEGCGVVAVVVRSTTAALAALAFSMLPLALGAVGTTYSRSVVRDAVAMVDPADKAIILEAGNKEAMRPLQLGGLATLFTAPTGVIAFVIARRKKA